MGGMIMAVPVLLPLAGGAGMLALHFQSEEKRDDRLLEFLTEGLVFVNSLVIFGF